MITGWTPTRPSERASREGEGLRQWMRRAAAAVAAIAFEGRSDSLRSSSVTPRGGMSRKLVTHDSPMCLGHAHCWTGLMKYSEALIADILCDFFICSTWWVRYESVDLLSGADESSAPLCRSNDSSYPPSGADEKFAENISLDSLSQAEKPCRAVACLAFCITELVKQKNTNPKL